MNSALCVREVEGSALHFNTSSEKQETKIALYGTMMNALPVGGKTESGILLPANESLVIVQPHANF